MVIARFRDMVNTSAWKGFNMFPEESYGHRIYVYLLSIWNSLEAIVDANGEKPDIHTHTRGWIYICGLHIYIKYMFTMYELQTPGNKKN